VRRHLTHKTGVNDKVKNEIVSDIFGKNGLLQQNDSYSYDERVLILRNVLTEKVPTFVGYFDGLVDRLKRYVFLPAKRHEAALPLNWTNNNCESINNIVKLSTGWKILKIPDLIEQLYNIVRLQYADIRRAIHGQGNHEVVQALRKHVISQMTWSQKSDAEKDDLTQKFLRAKIQKKRFQNAEINGRKIRNSEDGSSR